jgi:fatty acid-binding protein DegV
MPKPVSGTYNQWKLIASEYDNVFVYNTMAPGHNMKWLVEDILKIEDVNHEKVEALASEFYKKTNIGLVVRDLKYAIRGGRVGIIKGGLAILLKLNVILDLTDHGFEVSGKTNRVDKIFPLVAEVLKAQCGYDGNNIERLCIYTSGSKDPKFDCDIIAKSLKKGFNFKDIEFAEFPPVFLSHAGPNYVGFSIKVK